MDFAPRKGMLMDSASQIEVWIEATQAEEPTPIGSSCWRQLPMQEEAAASVFTALPMMCREFMSGRMKDRCCARAVSLGGLLALHGVPYSIDPECKVRKQLMESAALYIAIPAQACLQV